MTELLPGRNQQPPSTVTEVEALTILDPSQLLDEWHRRFHHLKRAHFRAAWWYEKRNRCCGRGTIILSAAVAPFTFILAKAGLESDIYWVAFVTLIAALAGILATLQIFDRDSERAERHRVAGSIYAKLEGDVEEVCAFYPIDRQTLQQHAQQFRDEWHRLTGSSPVIPERIFIEVEGEIERRPPFRILSVEPADAKQDAPADRPPTGR
ncbi:SLATT domain-containing protein [Nitrospira sp. Ecomares 2.1]